VKRAIRTSEQTFLLQLIGVVRMIVESPKLLVKLLDPVTVPKLFDAFMGSLQWADASIEFHIIQTLKIIYTDENGKIHVLKSEQILNYIVKCLTRQQDIQIANEAALILIEILKEPGRARVTDACRDQHKDIEADAGRQEHTRIFESQQHSGHAEGERAGQTRQNYS